MSHMQEEVTMTKDQFDPADLPKPTRWEFGAD